MLVRCFSDSQLSFGVAALSHLLQALRERPMELQEVISDGVSSMLQVIAALPVHGVAQMQVLSSTVDAPAYPCLFFKFAFLSGLALIDFCICGDD